MHVRIVYYLKILEILAILLLGYRIAYLLLAARARFEVDISLCELEVYDMRL